MAGRYVPPALRQKQQQQAAHSPDTPDSSTAIYKPISNAETDQLYSLREIYAHFWKKSLRDTDGNHKSTLHASSDNPNGLAWVVLHKAANPQWDSNRVIFVKSNLDLLPEVQAYHYDGSDNQAVKKGEDDSGGGVSLGSGLLEVTSLLDHEPDQTSVPDMSEREGPAREGPPESHPAFAVFAEEPAAPRGSDARNFRFVDWHKITRIEILAPNSHALVGMLEKKWEIRDKFGRTFQRKRNEEAWENSMMHKWAVLNMEVDTDATQEKGVPEIEMISDGQEGGGDGSRTVNKMLAELRLEHGESNHNMTAKNLRHSVTELKATSGEFKCIGGVNRHTADVSPGRAHKNMPISKERRSESHKESECTEDELYTLRELHAYFGGRSDAGTLGRKLNRFTLQTSPDDEETISWVLLSAPSEFRWINDRMVYVVTKLRPPVGIVGNDALQLYADAEKAESVQTDAKIGGMNIPATIAARGEYQTPITGGLLQAVQVSLKGASESRHALPIFVQQPQDSWPSRPSRSVHLFKFKGWYKVCSLEILPRSSEGLVRMLTEKLQRMGKSPNGLSHRDRKIWLRNLEEDWVALRFALDKEALTTRGVPRIGRLEETADTVFNSDDSDDDIPKTLPVGMDPGNRTTSRFNTWRANSRWSQLLPPGLLT